MHLKLLKMLQAIFALFSLIYADSNPQLQISGSAQDESLNKSVA